MFPILYRGKHARTARRANPQWPDSIPWGLAARHAARLEQWYGSPLDQLAERGGLTPHDLLAAINDSDPNGHVSEPFEGVMVRLIAAVAALEAEAERATAAPAHNEG